MELVLPYTVNGYIPRSIDPYTNRFIQPDTVVPVASNPQSWNRYANTLNDPLKYSDPSGHRPIIDNDEDGRLILDPDWRPRKTNSKRSKEDHPKTTNQKVDSNLGFPCPLCSLWPDATLISVNYSYGYFDYYQTVGFDIVITNDEIGLFWAESVGPGSGVNTIPYSIDGRYNDSYVTPHANAQVSVGPLWGDSLRESVRFYEGTSRVGGGIFIEHIETVDSVTGEYNDDIKGIIFTPGTSFGIPDFRDVYTLSTWIDGFSYFP